MAREITLSENEVAYLRKVIALDVERLARWFEKANKKHDAEEINSRLECVKSIQAELKRTDP